MVFDHRVFSVPIRYYWTGVHMEIPKIKIVRDGIVVVVDAYILCFFCNETHDALITRVEKVLGMYVNLVGLSSLPYWLDDDGELVDIDEDKYDDFRCNFFHRETEQHRSVIRLVGAIDDETGYGFTYIASEAPDKNHPHERNLVALWLPTSHCADLGWDRVFDFSCSVAAALPFTYGYGSPCLCYSINQIRDAIGVAKRYPGFDIALNEACRVDIGSKALGAYWLSFYGEVLSQSLGGKEQLARQLPSPITVNEIADSKIVVRLGLNPEVGDNNRQIDLPLYCHLAKVLEHHLHIPECVYFRDENWMPDKDGMMSWHRRFLAD